MSKIKPDDAFLASMRFEPTPTLLKRPVNSRCDANQSATRKPYSSLFGEQIALQTIREHDFSTVLANDLPASCRWQGPHAWIPMA